MEKQHLKPFGSFYASTTQEAKKDQFLAAEPSEKKRKYQHNSDGEKNSGVSTELTLFCGVPSKINKPRIKEINSSPDNEINAIVVSTRLANEVSTELKLFDESWFTAFAATREEPVVSKESSDSESKSLVQNIAETTSSPEDERKESPMHDVPTILMLSDPWKIKKKLTGSDLALAFIEELCFHQRLDIQFVKRRNLVEGDLIGIYWDPSNSRFNFSVLERA
ncbi:hypothetical protein GH714_013222 [Hevea brasiliensis]|uniref:TF-B3 domain-containing protein n=1 Tax=Hevea brasiliensis TaxID=3981 RepID=A0A6A6N9S6_HEVBR|nr:hypothetical protein GH714_013222 [Hevea brasiliensis]